MANETARRTETITFAGRDVMVYEPADTQKAVLAQIARSTRVDMMTKVARLIDLIDALFVVQTDRDWFADNLLEGNWSFEEEVIGGLTAIASAFGDEPANRQERRAPAKKATARRSPR